MSDYTEIDGCSNHGCYLNRSKKIGTNGQCTCVGKDMDNEKIFNVKHALEQRFQLLAEREKLRADITALKEQLGEAMQGIHRKNELIGKMYGCLFGFGGHNEPEGNSLMAEAVRESGCEDTGHCVKKEVGE